MHFLFVGFVETLVLFFCNVCTSVLFSSSCKVHAADQNDFKPKIESKWFSRGDGTVGWYHGRGLGSCACPWAFSWTTGTTCLSSVWCLLEGNRTPEIIRSVLHTCRPWKRTFHHLSLWDANANLHCTKSAAVLDIFVATAKHQVVGTNETFFHHFKCLQNTLLTLSQHKITQEAATHHPSRKTVTNCTKITCLSFVDFIPGSDHEMRDITGHTQNLNWKKNPKHNQFPFYVNNVFKWVIERKSIKKPENWAADDANRYLLNAQWKTRGICCSDWQFHGDRNWRLNIQMNFVCVAPRKMSNLGDADELCGPNHNKTGLEQTVVQPLSVYIIWHLPQAATLVWTWTKQGPMSNAPTTEVPPPNWYATPNRNATPTNIPPLVHWPKKKQHIRKWLGLWGQHAWLCQWNNISPYGQWAFSDRNANLAQIPSQLRKKRNCYESSGCVRRTLRGSSFSCQSDKALE